MKFINICLLMLFSAAGSLFSQQSFADTHWTLENVSFSDQGTANGDFSLNVYGFFNGIAIDTTAGSTLGAATYPNPAVASNIDNTKTIVDFYRTGFAYGYSLVIEFQNALTSPGIDPIVIGSNSYEESNTGIKRYITAGYATTVPEPAIIWQVLAGLVLFATRATHKTKSA